MRFSSEFLEFFSLLSLCAAIIGMLFLLLLPKDDKHRRLKACAIFVFGMVGMAFSFLIKNPEIRETLERHIALTLIGMVIATLSVIKIMNK